jgi:2-polyprenyl-3-methyl-5-hydroxy-6-metoxy-1,4-benzoquinol methylase
MLCRICNKKISNIFTNLGKSPLANSYLERKGIKEKYYPLKVFYCKNCYLPQLPQHFYAKKIFKNYDYFSSYSTTWLSHCKKFVDDVIFNLKLNKKNKICEIASNDGYLLQYFKKKNFCVLGVEPAENVAKVAIKCKKIPTIIKFFGLKNALIIKKKYGLQDLIICNNVLAHVPNIIDFVLGLKNLLSEKGIVTIEFPHFYNLIKKVQFDTIYHEHFSYLSLTAIIKLFEKFQLNVFNVKKLKTHGGSLRVYIKHKNNKNFSENKKILKITNMEKNSKIFSYKTFLQFNKKIAYIKNKTKIFLNNLKKRNKKIIIYGAAAKGNTFLNYCGINNKLVNFAVDKSKSKIGKFLPGSKIPIYATNKIYSFKPDYIMIMPWNLKDEIIKEVKKEKFIGKFLTFIPDIKVYQ